MIIEYILWNCEYNELYGSKNFMLLFSLKEKF